ncbi:MAG: RNA polymerase sigma factor [Bacteroidales bacterium]|jgi:RNA polymerase sigma-70 factor (ECF subfamily)|nr:RNA polymerase sigma factor [Bacteroidales bacterium]
MNHNDELSLIAKIVVEKDNRAFEGLVKKYQSQIRRYFLNQTLGNKDLSDDLAQETFIKAYLNLASFKNLSGFSTWLYKIAFNTLCDYLRKNKIPNNVIAIGYVNSQSEKIHNNIDIYNAMKILKEDERSCISLFYIDDLSIETISSVMEIPEGTVKSHLSRGKSKMAQWLKNNGYE